MMLMITAGLAGFLFGAAVHWRVWRDILRTRRWLQHGRRIDAQFGRLRKYREQYLDARVSRHESMTDDERTRLEAEVAWWRAASEETCRQADEWRQGP